MKQHIAFTKLQPKQLMKFKSGVEVNCKHTHQHTHILLASTWQTNQRLSLQLQP